MKQKYTIMIADVQMNIVTDETPENVEAIVGILDRRIREIYLQSGNRCPKNEAALLCALDYCAERNRLQETVNKLEEEKKNDESEALRAEVARLADECDGIRAQLAETEEKFRSANADAGIAGEQIRILTQKAVTAENNANELSVRVQELEQKLAEANRELSDKDNMIDALRAAAASTVPAESAAEEPATPVTEDNNTTMPEEPAAPVVAEETVTERTEEATAEKAEEPVVEETVRETAEPAAEVPAEEEKPTEKAPVSELADSVDSSFEIEMKPLRKQVDENQLTIDTKPAAEPEKNLSDAATMEKEKQKAQKRVRSMFDLITFDNV